MKDEGGKKSIEDTTGKGQSSGEMSILIKLLQAIILQKVLDGYRFISNRSYLERGEQYLIQYLENYSRSEIYIIYLLKMIPIFCNEKFS